MGAVRWHTPQRPSRLDAALTLVSLSRSQVMRFARPGLTEHHLTSHFTYHASLRGGSREAYVPVCASGQQALTIHYLDNNRPIKQGEMVLLDAGCELGGYASDITRASRASTFSLTCCTRRSSEADAPLFPLRAGVFPVSGTFSTAQAHLYEAVLRVEKQCITHCRASADLSLEELHRVSVDLTRTELRDLGFNLRGGDLERVLYPHFLTHPLGVDLHDTMTFSRNEKCVFSLALSTLPADLGADSRRRSCAGSRRAWSSCVPHPPAVSCPSSATLLTLLHPLARPQTIEPGVYVPPLAHFPKGFHNLVVRIEDEVLVGADDQTVLSVNAPKELVDVEACCQGLLEGVGRPKEVWED